MGELHVSFVCTGDICRSPMAALVAGTHRERSRPAGRVRAELAGEPG